MIFTRRSTDSTVSTLEQPCKADGNARTHEAHGNVRSKGHQFVSHEGGGGPGPQGHHGAQIMQARGVFLAQGRWLRACST
jgi:hypothetical protein